MKIYKILINTLIITAIFVIINSCLKEDPIKIPFKCLIPIDIADGWEIAAPEDVKIDTEKLKEVYKYVHESDKLWQIRSLLVFKNNKLVAESYMKDPNDIVTPAVVWSCTKQIVGVLTGIAIDNNYITSVHDPISKYLPQTQNTDKSLITIENLLTMQSGINYENAGIGGETGILLRQKTSNSLDFILGLGIGSTSGNDFFYNGGDAQIISAIIQRTTNRTMRDWAKEYLFNKLGISRLEWQNYKDGLTLGGFGILTTPRELAKIAHLVMDYGMWENERIVSSEWITEMITPRVVDKILEDDVQYMGYHWWIYSERDIVMMRGSGGQRVIINKSKKLVIVIMSEPNTVGKSSTNDDLEIYDWINSITEEDN